MAHEHAHAETPTARAGLEVIRHRTVMDYIFTFAALLVLLVVTVVLYYIDISKATGWVGANLVIALIVALIKATLVVWNFMNVRGGTRLVFLWAVLGFIWLLFMAGIFLDYQTRPWVDHSGWEAVSPAGNQ